MNRTILGLILACCAVSAAAGDGGPVQIFISADQNCKATLQPGQTDLKAVFPGAQYTYKKPTAVDKSGLLYQSCEITVPKEEFLKQFEFCALSSFSSSSCWLSYQFAGGRSVDFSVLSTGAKKPVPAHCGFVCLKK